QSTLRDLFMRLATKRLVQAHWTDEILDECFSSILGDRPDLKKENLDNTRVKMNRAVPYARVVGYKSRIDSLKLPDPNDRHVLAAAIHCSAEFVVTLNLKDFPDDLLKPYRIEAKSPDLVVGYLL